MGRLVRFGVAMDEELLGRFDALARPNWLRGAIPTAATWPQLGDSYSAHE